MIPLFRKSPQNPLEMLIVTNTLHPYQRHNISILSLIPGTTYRFRYEASFFVLDQPEEIDALRGKLGILVLRDYSRATFIPLRMCRVFRVEFCGDFVFLDLEFLSFVQYGLVTPLFERRGSDSSEAAQAAREREHAVRSEREKYNRLISKLISDKAVENSPGEPIKKLIIPVEPARVSPILFSDSKSDESAITAWSRLVTLLGGIDSYRTACFYFMPSIRELDSGARAAEFKTDWRRGIKLYSGKSYALRVFQMMASGQAAPGAAFNIKVNSLPKHILPLRTSELVDGAYDRLEFFFHVLPQETRSTHSVLVLDCDQRLSDPRTGQDAVAIPGSFMHMLLKWTKWEFFRRRVLPIPVIVAGIATWFFAPQVAEWLGHGVRAEYVQLVSLFILAVGFQNWGVFTGAFKYPTGGKG